MSELEMSLDESMMNKSQEGTAAATTQKKKKSQPLVENQSMLAEWENIHNKVLFDAVNDNLDDFRPYG